MINIPSYNTSIKSCGSLYLNSIYRYQMILGIVFTLMGAVNNVHAAPHVEVIALFEDKAMLHINKDQVLVSIGETTKHGVILISADAHAAVIEIEGVRRKYLLGNVVRNTDADENKAEAEILVYQDTDTMFRTIGSMNGYPVNFLVDTGASSIAMSSKQAKRLGINYKLDGKPTWVSTASGVERAVTVSIDRVTISGITIRSVEGLVIEGSEPSITLLGMSYLTHFKIINDGNLMRLKRKY